MDFLIQAIEAEIRNSLLEVYKHIENLEENKPFMITYLELLLPEKDTVIQTEYVDKDADKFFIKKNGYLYFVNKGEIKEKFSLKSPSEFVDYNIVRKRK